MRLSSGILCTLTLGTIFAGQANSPFLSVPAMVPDALVFRSQLGDFEATDLSGRLWRSADLKGKVTLVSIWATFCPPCRQEHPELQRFYEDTRSMKGIQVLTFSLDEDARRTRAYLSEYHLTFPVIVDRALGEKLFPTEGGIPKSWVIDREGRRSEPFHTWTFGRVLLEAEKLSR
jgi:thiol-disulfide isomerase/thioredoxin